MKRFILLTGLLIFVSPAFANAIESMPAQENLSSQKEVALTIDDLPYVGDTKQNKGKLRREAMRFRKVLAVLKEEKVPAAGFVVTASIEQGQWELLKEFHQAGNILANHTDTHRGLGSIGPDRFIKEIIVADEKLGAYQSYPKYFRYPFLSTGKSCKTYMKVRNFLKDNGYVIAPVTIDAKDFNLNVQLHAIRYSQRKYHMASFRRRYIGFILRQTKKAEQKAFKYAGRPVKQILLIHMNTLNAHLLKDVIIAMRKSGYHFITLSEALSDPYYHELESPVMARERLCLRRSEKQNSAE